MNPIELYLNKPQFKKYSTGKSFQLTKSQIESDQAENKVSILLSKNDFKKLTSNMKKNKGYRFKPVGEVLETKQEEIVEGEGVSSKKKRFLKGSEEAKQFMLNLRNRRKKKEGEISVDPVDPVLQGGDLKSIVKSVKRTYTKRIKPVLKSVGKKILENAVVAGIDVLSENPVIGEISRPLIKKGISKISKSIGLGVKYDKHPTHQFLYSNLVGGVPMSNNEIKNIKVGGSFKSL